MKTIKNETNVKRQFAKVLANVALGLGIVAVNSTCCFIYHQPKIPGSLKEMRKF